MAGFEVIQGDTFSGNGTHTDASGDPVDLTTANVEATMRHPNGDVFAFTTAVTSPLTGAFTFSATATQTRLWRPGLWRLGFRYTDGDVKQEGEAFVRVKRGLFDDN